MSSAWRRPRARTRPCGSISYFDKNANLTARYTNVSKGLPGRLHLAGSNVAVHTALYK